MVEILDQCRLTVARRRAGKALFLVKISKSKRVADRQVFRQFNRQLLFHILLRRGLRLVIKLFLVIIDPHKACKKEPAARCPEEELFSTVLHINPRLFDFCGSHHGGKKALPDQLIQFKLIG